jgi:hypothetical protein
LTSAKIAIGAAPTAFVAEFDFRYNTTDLMGAELAAAGIKGKRLTYRRPHKQDQVEAH